MWVPFPEALRRFDDYLVVLGRSVRTRHTYRYQLVLLWCDFLFSRGLEIETLTEDDLVDYLGGLARNGRSRVDATKALRALFAWAEGRLRSDNPMSHLRTPRPKSRPAPDLPDAELRALMRAAFRRERRRGWAIMLCYATGARVGSLAALRPGDIELDGDARVTFRVTKGDRPYSVPLGHMGRIAAEHLLELRLPTLIGVGPTRFGQWVETAEQTAGIRHVWPHLLRHAFSHRVGRSTDPETWRRLMNHADLSQWARYNVTSDERLRAAVESL
ncbi:MAG: tyrosine-type recombinase/integrase [Actinomycetota bacterium]